MKHISLFPMVLLFMFMALPVWWTAAAQVPQLLPTSPSGSPESPDAPQPVVGRSIKVDLSPPLRSIRPVEALSLAEPEVRVIPRLPLPRGGSPLAPASTEEGFRDPVLQDRAFSLNMPATISNFGGLTNTNFVLPPDTNGDVGPNHYVQTVNLSFGIWDKSGNRLYGPANINTLWNGFGGACETTNDGDPIVLYDSMADRWMLSQFALPSFPSGPFYQCIAVSQTPDPTGAWYRYAFLASNTKMNDYPKFGVWPDGYYMSVNQFNAGSLSWGGAGAFVFERSKMLTGESARMVYYDLGSVNSFYGGLLPADLDGARLPPAGSPNYFAAIDDNAWGIPSDVFHIWKFRVDWTNPLSSTFTGPTDLPTASFDANMCGYSSNCIPQPDTAAKVDAISDRLMYRLQYRNFGDHEALVANHTVDVGGDHAGIRWYEIRDPGGTPTIYQQGTYAPDSEHRWMGSIATDRVGNMALGYSVASTSTYPSIRYTGRLVTDTAGTMPQGEPTLIAGGGSQTHSTGRWGDYSSMSVDSTDGCTFWYAQEYYDSTSSAGWKTRIGSFAFPSCLAVPEAGFSASPVSGTLPLTVTFANQSLGEYTASLWNFGDGVTSTQQSPTHTYTSTGAYTVTLSASGTGGSNTITRTNYIAAYVPVIADFTASPLTGTVPLTVSFTNLSVGNTSSLWSFGDGVTSTLTSPTHAYSNGGVYTVTLVASNLGGSSTITRTNHITVYQPPVATFTGSPTSGISPLAVTFTNQSTGDYISSLWSFGDGVTSTLQSPAHTYTVTGTFTVTLAVSGPAGSDTLARSGFITVTDYYMIYLPLVTRNSQ